MKLGDAASVLRSKNSGPFEITIDVLFRDPEVYSRIKQSGVISRTRIAELYNIEEASISHLVYFDQALGLKVTFARPVSSGTRFDRDVYGAQQHAPLLDLELSL